MEYLFEKLKKYGASDHYGFHMPGHKRNGCPTGAELPYDIDITEIEGFDDLHHPEGILNYAQKRAAAAFHAEESHYLVNGSTAGILSAVLGSTRRGDKIVMARNCHRSVYNAVLMNELKPVYLYPQLIQGTELNGEINPEEVEQALAGCPDAKAVVITSPTYDGVVSDIRSIAQAVHKRGIPLIVDEAHGAHFGFHPYFPENGNQQGADVVIHSLHKTLPALTQSALLHMNGELADRKRIRKYLHMLQTSSPSYVLMAGIDECIRMLETRGEELFGEYVLLLDKTRRRLGNLKILELIETGRYDRSKLVLSTERCMSDGESKENNKEEIKIFTGKDLYDILNEKYLLQLEMAAASYAIAMTSLADTEEGMDRFVSALEEIDGKLAKYKKNERNDAYSKGQTRLSKNIAKTNIANEQVFSPYRAEQFEGEGVPFAKCAGRIVLEYAYVYPPGIPLTVPGERVSADTAAQLQRYESTGFRIEGTQERGKIQALAESGSRAADEEQKGQKNG